MEHSQIEDYFYKIGILFPLGVVSFVVASRVFSGILQGIQLPPCLFHHLTGYYCPGCGGTRAVIALLHGRLFLSMYYHPLVPYTAAIYLVFMVTQTVGRIRRQPQIGMRFHLFYVWIALAILFVNCIVKNVLHFTNGFVL